jgi:hypothetical protein
VSADRRTRTEGAPARRALTLSEVVERLLARGSSDHSSVTLSRNAKGDTQIEVVVRSSSEGAINTVGEAAREAVRLYDVLRARYPTADGFVGSYPTNEKSTP